MTMQSRRPHAAAKVFEAERSGRLKALLHQSPRQFGKARSTWTLALAAEVCVEQGVTAERVSLETIRGTPQAAGGGLAAGEKVEALLGFRGVERQGSG